MVFLFDIDGTLVATGGAGLRALERAMAELHGVEGAAAGVRAAGKTDPLIVGEIFELRLRRPASAADVDAVIARYLVHLADEVAHTEGYRVMPGVHRALALLEARGATVGLATGNVEKGAEIKLARGDLWRRFPFGGYGSDAADRGQLVARAIERAGRRAGRALDPAEVWVIGDTPRDVAAAHACGAQAVGVATGPHSTEVLARAGAEVVLETLEELEGWLA